MLSTIRPTFGNGKRQVRSLKGIKVGGHYIWYNRNMGACQLYQVIKGPYQKEQSASSWWIDVNLIDIEGRLYYATHRSLVDHSIVPNEIGLWNPTNCLLRTRAKTSRGLKRHNPKRRFTPKVRSEQELEDLGLDDEDPTYFNASQDRDPVDFDEPAF